MDKIFVQTFYPMLNYVYTLVFKDVITCLLNVIRQEITLAWALKSELFNLEICTFLITINGQSIPVSYVGISRI